MRNRPRRLEGHAFTLVELVLTTFLMSVVMVIIASVLSGGIRTWERGEGAVHLHQRLRVLRYRMGRDLRGILPYEPIPMTGDSHGVRFVTTDRPNPADPPSLVEVRYEVEPAPEGERLTRTKLSLLTGREKTETLLESASAIQFSYPFRKDEEGELIWKERWESSNQKEEIPEWVRVAVVLKEGEAAWTQLFWVPRGMLREETGEGDEGASE